MSKKQPHCRALFGQVLAFPGSDTLTHNHRVALADIAYRLGVAVRWAFEDLTLEDEFFQALDRRFLQAPSWTDAGRAIGFEFLRQAFCDVLTEFEDNKPAPREFVRVLERDEMRWHQDLGFLDRAFHALHSAPEDLEAWVEYHGLLRKQLNAIRIEVVDYMPEYKGVDEMF